MKSLLLYIHSPSLSTQFCAPGGTASMGSLVFWLPTEFEEWGASRDQMPRGWGEWAIDSLQLCLHRTSKVGCIPLLKATATGRHPRPYSWVAIPLPPFAPPGLEVVTASQCYYFQGNALSLSGSPNPCFCRSIH